jgi:hypothetical protein
MMLLYVLAGALSAIFSGSVLYEWWVERVSRSWPVAEVKLDSADIEPARARTRYLLRLHYSYFVAGSLYGGAWFKYFRTKSEADRVWDSLQGILVLVRYDPKRHDRSYFDPFRDVRIEKSAR